MDYDADEWSGNTVNDDPSHQRMTWIPADNEYQYFTYMSTRYYTSDGARNDPFPYGNVNAFGKNTTPAATLYNKNADGTYYLDCSIQNITQNGDGTVSFLFNGESNMVPTTPFALDNNSDNSTAIATAATNGGYYDMTLSNRTLWKDGKWNTLCLPFNTDLIGDLDGATLMELDVTGKYDTDKQTGLDTDGTLYIYFKEATSIRAGTPYIIKWEGTNMGDPIENPTFNGVAFSNASTEVSFNGGKFVGSYSPQSFTAEDKSVLFMGGENKLYYPENGAFIGTFRAYFDINSNDEVKGFVLNLGDEGPTPVPSLYGGGTNHSPLGEAEGAPWYTLDGRRLNGKPTTKGVYIVNGRKMAVK